jgi:immunoglobulin-binding protein 1
MLLPSGASLRPSEDEDELDSEVEDASREAILVLLRLLYTQGQTRMDNVEQEFDLLRNAPADRTPVEDVPQEQRRTADDNMWRLEPLQPIDHGVDGKGPLIDSSGKVRFTPCTFNGVSPYMTIASSALYDSSI